MFVLLLVLLPTVEKQPTRAGQDQQCARWLWDRRYAKS